MDARNRVALCVALATVLVSFTPEVLHAAISLTANVVTDPNADGFLILQPRSSTEVPIRVEASGYPTPFDVTVSPHCCVPSLVPIPAPAGVTVSSDHVLTVTPNSPSTIMLRISTNGTPAPGMYTATVTVLNPTLAILRSVDVPFGVNGADSTFKLLAASPGAVLPSIPDLSPPPRSSNIPVFVVSDSRFIGRVALNVSCCLDVITNSRGPVAGARVAQPLPAVVHMIGRGTKQVPEVHRVLIPVATTPPSVLGRFHFTVTAKDQLANQSSTDEKAFTEFTDPGRTPTCFTAAEVWRVAPFVNNLVTSILLGRHRIAFGMVFAAYNRNGVEWTLEDDPTVPRDEALVVFENASDGIAALSTVGCSSKPQAIVLPPGGKTTTRLKEGVDKTIIFQHPFTGTTMTNLAIFSEDGLWRLMGGRKSTFTWLSPK